MLSYKLSPKALRRLEAGQLWFWPSDLENSQELPGEAAALLLEEPRGRVAASALYDPQSPAPMRVYARKKLEFNEAMVQAAWEKALAWRKRIIPAGDTGYRLVHSEADAMPGLIADRFGSHVSFAVSMGSWRAYCQTLLQQLSVEGGVESATLEYGEKTEVIWGNPPERVSYRLNNLSFFAQPAGGQKTGAFLDQRDNYLALAKWIRCLGAQEFGLDLYTANGGFARHMLGLVGQIEAVDSSRAALAGMALGVAAQAQESGGAAGNLRMVKADVREYLQGKAASRRSYDVIVVDPPAFAKGKRQREDALRQYFDINQRALHLMRSGGLFVSCSCSHHVSGADLLEVVREAARANEKTLQVLERGSQSLDHSILLGMPESEYLKCLFFRIL